jgi:hypothetical protein
MGAQTALVTHRFATIGAMSCNPAIGGLGKGHLVREVDALDGLMGRVADAGGIQFRMLNRRKGPAVRGPRAQADRKLYAAAMQAAITETANLSVIEGEADELIVVEGRVTGIRLGDGRQLSAGAVVITTGTFLRGLIHLGEKNWPAGRVGEAEDEALLGGRGIDDVGVAVGAERALADEAALEVVTDERRRAPVGVAVTAGGGAAIALEEGVDVAGSDGVGGCCGVGAAVRVDGRGGVGRGQAAGIEVVVGVAAALR